ncbi:MAG: GNAT family N-acetyltransferase [Desulfobacterales bacterium]
MTIEMQHNLETVCWEKLAEVFEKAPLGTRDPLKLRKVFENSRYCCFFYDQNQIIGSARVLSDGYDCAVICDVVVLPEYQNQQLGSRMIQYLMQQVADHNKILLYAAPGKEGFYQRFSFRRMKTAMAVFKDREKAEKMNLIEKDR